MCASTGRSTRTSASVSSSSPSPAPGLLAERGHRLADQPDVEVEPDAGDVPALLGAQDVARAADLQVLHRHRRARAQLGVLRDGGEPVVRGLGERVLRREQEVGVAALAAAADPAAQLVQLGEPERVAALDDQRVGVGDVQPVLDDRGADQHVVLAVPEPVDGASPAGPRSSARARPRPGPPAPARGSCRAARSIVETRLCT